MSGAVIQDVPAQIDRMVELLNGEYKSVKDEWKMVTLFIVRHQTIHVDLNSNTLARVQTTFAEPAMRTERRTSRRRLRMSSAVSSPRCVKKFPRYAHTKYTKHAMYAEHIIYMFTHMHKV